MNARQKAKYYKRKYEELANMPLPKFTVNNYKVDTLRFQRLYPDALIVNGDENKIIDIITRDLANELVSQMDKYVIVKSCFEPHLNQYKFVGEIKVVRAKSEVRDEYY